MRLVAFSDLHIHAHRFGASIISETGRNSRLQDCLNVLNVTAQATADLGASARLFCGDLFHVRGVLKPSILTPVLEHFRSRPSTIQDFMIVGNHDMEARTDGAHALEVLKEHVNTTVLDGFDYKVFGTWLAPIGIGWVSYAPDISELKTRIARVVAMRRTSGDFPKFTIFMLHHGVDGAMPGIPDMGFGPASLPTDDFDLVLCGDYHNHYQFGHNSWMVGAPLQHNFGDAGQKRGYMVIDLQKGRSPVVALHEIPGIPKFVCWDQGSSVGAAEIAGNFVRVRAETEAELNSMVEAATKAGAVDIQRELVRGAVSGARSGLTLSMSTRDLFNTWAADQKFPPEVDLNELMRLNDVCLSEAGVS